MELVLGFGAGLLTLINPCVLPILPLVIGSALQGNRYGPLALASGMAVTFTVLGVGVSAVGPAFGVDDTVMAMIGAYLMIGFGLVLLVPVLNRGFVAATTGMSGQADETLHELSGNGLRIQFLSGTLLGAVWSPCIGPTLGGAMALASQGKNLWWTGAIMASFALGVSVVILLLSYGTREVVGKRKHVFHVLATKSNWIMGGLLVAVGLSILFGLHHVLEGMLLDVLPYWLQDLSVAL